jgi:predicted RNase H-related nuclease YkuK (DUF458 family)
MLKERQIRDLSQKEYSYDEFLSALQEYDKEGYEAYVGTDSQVHKGKIYVATCVAFVRKETRDGARGNRSGKIFYVKENISTKEYSGLRIRMMLEAYRSLETAMEIEPMFKNTIHVHLDIGPNPRKSRTSAFKVELTGMITGQGYECSIKPDAWCASGVADKVCR